MKTTIRTNVFETNSSSTHSIILVKTSDFKLWKEGKTAYLWRRKSDVDFPDFIPIDSKRYTDQFIGIDKDKEEYGKNERGYEYGSGDFFYYKVSYISFQDYTEILNNDLAYDENEYNFDGLELTAFCAYGQEY
jgi:hypothetical protein